MKRKRYDPVEAAYAVVKFLPADPNVTDFEEDPCSWRERQAIAARRRRSVWWRNYEWIRSHEWPARVVIVIGEITIVYLALALGLLIGVGLGPIIGS